ncbi:DUF799 domain-containing protein [Duganella sp. FT3S]|uniref:DUF799 domain-containing protein n=1 Tax=Rugamonas fusca TaxID=2758568 RepID=A0A7W2EIW7_9BURK|nr:DUF799 domain-containing protein [Rugamonas fusca]MBA5606774.1 DUF799 domain-containing protein [Rugamonas fusca]
MLQRVMKLAACLAPAMLAVGCATHQATPYDYTAFKAAKPRSIVVLPPLNTSPEVTAGYTVLSQVTYPLAEAGYYVLPVALVEETFKQNGLSSAEDAQAVDPRKLHSIFGADAALYLTVTNFGASYTVLNSVVTVSAKARLVDLKTGTTLWTGEASANNDANNNNGGGLVGALVAAAVKQIINNSTDASYPVAGAASQRLLAAGQVNGMLYGPRSVYYKQQ